MILYIKDNNEKLLATCKYKTDKKTLVLEKSSLIKKTFNCLGCNEVNKLRETYLQQGKLADHNEEVYLLKENIEFKDINSAACFVLGGKLEKAETLIKNEFGKTLREIYSEVL